ncbi:hypothetical protein PIB30_009085 [Stylosanthes scabra]|uniref:Uncharacterized protein n=1 Tax=Stylosanthes scabra TaxID=79078 RepID=A0ABU6V789_9FABA|nr:hypothetical protein [Stylosanthes scabra]
MPTSLGISDDCRWRVSGRSGRLRARVVDDRACGGAMDNCVYALSLASRYGFRFKLTLFKLE